MLFEEGNDDFIQVIHSSHSIRHSLGMIRSNHAAPKELLECVKQLDISLMLYNREFRQNLKASGHLRVRIDSNEETAFAVHKSDNPLCLQPSRMWLNVKSLRVLHFGAFPADCPLVRRILTAVTIDSEYRSAV